MRTGGNSRPDFTRFSHPWSSIIFVGIRKIVVATDGSAVADIAVRAAVELAAALKEPAEVHAVSVVDYADVPAFLGDAPPDAPDLLALEAQHVLDDAVMIAAELDAPVTAAMLRGHVTHEILEYVHAIKADLIVMGTHGRKELERTLLGSVCDAVVRSSDVPVLTVCGAVPGRTVRPEQSMRIM